MSWQGARKSSELDPVEYLVKDAADFVHEHLEEATRERVTAATVLLVLEWQMHYQQVVAPRGSTRPVVGSGEALEYVLERASEAGRNVDPVDVAEIMAAEVEYLLSIGAIGTPVEEEGP
jgi:hypothetical protein